MKNHTYFAHRPPSNITLLNDPWPPKESKPYPFKPQQHFLTSARRWPLTGAKVRALINFRSL